MKLVWAKESILVTLRSWFDPGKFIFSTWLLRSNSILLIFFKDPFILFYRRSHNTNFEISFLKKLYCLSRLCGNKHWLFFVKGFKGYVVTLLRPQVVRTSAVQSVDVEWCGFVPVCSSAGRCQAGLLVVLLAKLI